VANSEKPIESPAARPDQVSAVLGGPVALALRANGLVDHPGPHRGALARHVLFGSGQFAGGVAFWVVVGVHRATLPISLPKPRLQPADKSVCNLRELFR